MKQLTRKQLTRGYPLVGVFPYIRENSIEYFGQLAKQGDTVSLKLGPYNAYVLNRAEDIEHVLSKNSKNYEKSPLLKNLKYIVGEGLLTSEGPDWVNDRRMVMATFTKSHYDSYARVVVNKTESLIKEWNGKGKTFDVRIDLSASRLMFHIISEILFSTDDEHHADTIEYAVRPILEFGKNRNFSYIRPPMWLPTPANLTFKRNYGALCKIADDLIQSHLDHPEKYNDLLSAMLREFVLNKSSLDMKRIRDHLITFIIAGHETSAMALVWTIYALAQNPKIQDLAREEAMNYKLDESVSIHDLEKYSYIKRCVEESLRLYPPAWKIDRLSKGDDELTDVKIEKDAFVLMFPYFVQRNPKYYESPLVYNPDNFLESNVNARHKMSYFPFGGGPRVCIAKHLAMMELILIIAKLLQNFSFKLVPEPPVEPVALITMRPAHGMTIAFKSL